MTLVQIVVQRLTRRAPVVFRHPLHQPMTLHRARRQTIEIKMFNPHVLTSLLQPMSPFLRLKLPLPAPFPLQTRAIRLAPPLVSRILGLEKKRHPQHREPQRIIRIERFRLHLAHRALQLPFPDVSVRSHGVRHELHRNQLMFPSLLYRNPRRPRVHHRPRRSRKHTARARCSLLIHRLVRVSLGQRESVHRL